MKRYQVIGGQYEPYWYGESDTLRREKIIATKHEEYLDNWRGWCKPNIYEAKDVEVITTHGMITHNDGSTIRVPKDFANPVCLWNEENHRWYKYEY